MAHPHKGLPNRGCPGSGYLAPEEKQMSDLKCPDCKGTLTVNNEWTECECCHFSCDTDKLENHTRTAPELPEGYEEKEHPHYGWMCLVTPDGHTIAKDKGDGFNMSGGHVSPRDAQALAIWLQRRNNE